MQPRTLILVVLAGVLPVSAVSAQSTDSCYVVEVPGTIVLPDDSEIAAGRLEVCLTRMYSPVSGLHRASVNGRVCGLFLSRSVKEEVEGDHSEPYFVFVRKGARRYEFDSYAWSNGSTRVTYQMRPVVRSRWQVRQAEAEAPKPENRGRVVLTASLIAGRR